VTPEFAESFHFPKSKGHGEFNIKYMEAAFKKEAGSGDFFIEFEENVWTHKLIECFQSRGAGQVMSSTFASNDGNDSASDALMYVFKSQDKNNIKYTRGTCPPALLDKVKVKQDAEICQCCQNCGMRMVQKRSSEDNGSSVVDEFDFVKKRKIIQGAFEFPDSSEQDSVGFDEAILDFIDFNEAVNSAFDDILAKDKSIILEEKDWIYQNAKPHAKTKFGYVYAAWNPCFEGLIKIGATMKDTPFERLKQLSGTSVPKTFELVACIPSLNPFALEKKAHAFFKDKRIRKNGRLTEFFKIDKETVSDYINTLFSE
jgi:hypothetical protein